MRNKPFGGDVGSTTPSKPVSGDIRDTGSFIITRTPTDFGG